MEKSQASPQQDRRVPSKTKGAKARLLVNGKSNFVWQTRAQLSKVAEQASVCKRIASHSHFCH